MRHPLRSGRRPQAAPRGRRQGATRPVSPRHPGSAGGLGARAHPARAGPGLPPSPHRGHDRAAARLLRPGLAAVPGSMRSGPIAAAEPSATGFAESPSVGQFGVVLSNVCSARRSRCSVLRSGPTPTPGPTTPTSTRPFSTCSPRTRACRCPRRPRRPPSSRPAGSPLSWIGPPPSPSCCRRVRWWTPRSATSGSRTGRWPVSRRCSRSSTAVPPTAPSAPPPPHAALAPSRARSRARSRRGAGVGGR